MWESGLIYKWPAEKKIKEKHISTTKNWRYQIFYWQYQHSIFSARFITYLFKKKKHSTVTYLLLRWVNSGMDNKHKSKEIWLELQLQSWQGWKKKRVVRKTDFTIMRWLPTTLPAPIVCGNTQYPLEAV